MGDDPSVVTGIGLGVLKRLYRPTEGRNVKDLSEFWYDET